MKSIIHHDKHVIDIIIIGPICLPSVVLCTISAFSKVAHVYIADNVSQIMNLKAINRYI